MKKIVFALFFSVWALDTRAQVVRSSVTSVVEEKVTLNMKYRGWIEAGIGADITDLFLTHEVTTTHGVQLSSGFFAGAGVGYFGHKKQTALPLYLDARQFFGRRRDRGFFAEARLGYNCPLKKNSYPWLPDQQIVYKMKGLFFSPGAGVTWKMVNLSVDYLLFREQETYEPSEDSYSYSRYKSCLQLRLGVNF